MRDPSFVRVGKEGEQTQDAEYVIAIAKCSNEHVRWAAAGHAPASATSVLPRALPRLRSPGASWQRPGEPVAFSKPDATRDTSRVAAEDTR
jgi:hypothetical protein